MNLYISEFEEEGKPDHRIQHEEAQKMLREIYGPGFEMGEEPGGKPYLTGVSVNSEICFSVSHCARAAVVLTDSRRAGTDIEMRFPYKENLARKVLSPAETRCFQTLAPELKERWLQVIWSRKESYLKYTGEGFRRRPDDITVWDGSEKLPEVTEHIDNYRYEGEHGLCRIDGRIVVFGTIQTETVTLCTCGMTVPEKIHFF